MMKLSNSAIQPLAAFCTLFVLSLFSGCQAATLTQTYIVKNGAPNAEIVIAEQPVRIAQIAANQLQDYVAQISGAKLPIVTKPSGNGTVAIYVGQSSYTIKRDLDVSSLTRGGYRMASGESDGGWLALLGRDHVFKPTEPYADHGHDPDYYKQVEAKIKELSGISVVSRATMLQVWRQDSKGWDLWASSGRGSLNAVNAFLYNLGCRWYMPGEIGQVIPKQPTIALPKVNKTVRPDFAQRDLHMMYRDFYMANSQETKDKIQWQLNQGLNVAPVAGGYSQSHGLDEFAGSTEFATAHTKCYAVINGEIRDKGDIYLRYSSPELVDATVKYVSFLYDHYDMRMVNILPPDGLTAIDDRDQDLATPQRGRSGIYSDYVWEFVNRVAKELYKKYPDRYVICGAYTTYLLPPLKIKTFSPNVAVRECTWRAWQTTSSVWTPARMQQLRDTWLSKLPSKQYYRWDYYQYARVPSTMGVPVYYPHLISKDLKSLKGKGDGAYIGVFTNFPGWHRDWNALASNHLNLWITARLWWDADQDVDALLDDYYHKFYGPAAGQMKAFVTYSEANWSQASKSAKIIDHMFELIDAAHQAAGSGIYGKRVDILVQYMQRMKNLRTILEKTENGRKNNPKIEAEASDIAKLTLDGKLEDPFWKSVRSYQLSENVTGQEVKENKTWFKMAWAGDNLVVAVHCEESDMANLKIGSNQPDSTGIWSGDEVEVLLETPQHSYYQLSISPSGAVTDLDHARGLYTLWNSEAKVEAYRGKDFWNLEIQIPTPGPNQEKFFADKQVSGARPTKTYPWFFNICRQRIRDGKTMQYAFSPTGGGFLKPDKFAMMY